MNLELSGHRGLVAILRGVKPSEIDAIGEALVAAGITLIEVPLNSPDPFDSIAQLVARLESKALVGAGTVLRVEDVDRLASIGAQIVVSPNTEPDVIAATKRHDMLSMPGVFTPTDAFTALKHGADVLKFFPAGALGPSGIGAIKAVLPKDTPLAAVGGVDVDSIAPYRAKGVHNFGIGSTLYKPGKTADEVGIKAEALVKAFDTT